ncbi:MAG: NADH-quinone oxidoreductase subunit NuoK [Deltaproteobacteria bacterium]|nr:MAG: NADH-quinone oxidoreductase subunit NuoK [Deltaproteobacteria bacterium]
MLSLPLSWYLMLSATLFVMGALGLLLRRNAIVAFMCVEVMLNAVNLTFIAFSKYHQDYTGQVFVFMVIAVAAAEAGIGLAMIVNMFRHKHSVQVDEATLLRH